MVLSDERLREHLSFEGWHAFKSLSESEIRSAITELLSRRAAEQQEPVAFAPVWKFDGSLMLSEARPTNDFPEHWASDGYEIKPLFASPQPRQQESGGWRDVGYLMSVIDAAIEGGFDPDEDGPLLDEIRAGLASPQPPVPPGIVGEQDIFEAILSGPHTITADEIVLRRAVQKPGNATSQLSHRIRAALLNGGSHDR